MKKFSIVLLALLLAGGFAFAEEHEAEAPATALDVSGGSVEFSIGTDGGVLSPSSATAADVSGSVNLEYAGEKVSGGLTVNLIPNYTFTAGDDLGDWNGDWGDDNATAATFEDNNTLAAPYDALVVLYDYAVAHGYSVAVVDSNLINADGEIKDLDEIVDADGTENERATDLALIANETKQLYDSLETEYNSSNTNNPDADDAWDALMAEAFGAESDAAVTADYPISDAYLKISGVADLLDLTFALSEGKYNVGSMVSKEMGDKPLGVEASLASGVVENLSASAFVGMFGKDSISDDLTTIYDESEDSSDAVWSMQASGGYDLAVDMLSVGLNASFGVVDMADLANSWFMSVPVSVAADMEDYSAGLDAELNFTNGNALSAAGVLSGTVMGVTPSVGFYYKNGNWGGDGSSELAYLDGSDGDETIDDGSSAALFGSADDQAAYRVTAGVSADLSDMIGYGVTVGFDFGMANAMTSDVSANDWAVNAAYAQDAVSASFSYANTKAWGITAGYAIDSNVNLSGAFDYNSDDEKYVSSVGLKVTL